MKTTVQYTFPQLKQVVIESLLFSLVCSCKGL